MNALDLFILAILALGLVRGFSTGVIRQVASVVGLVVAFVLSLQLMEPVGTLVAESLGLSARIAPLVGFVTVFLGIQVALFAAVKLVESVVGVLRLTLVNRLAGGAFGAFKAALLLSVAFLVIGRLGFPGDSMQQESVFYEPVADVLPVAWDFISEKLPQVESISQKFGERVQAELP